MVFTVSNACFLANKYHTNIAICLYIYSYQEPKLSMLFLTYKLINAGNVSIINANIP